MDPLMLMMLMGQQSGSAQPTGTFGLAMAYQSQQLLASNMNKAIVEQADQGHVYHVERLVAQRSSTYKDVSDADWKFMLDAAKERDAKRDKIIYS